MNNENVNNYIDNIKNFEYRDNFNNLKKNNI